MNAKTREAVKRYGKTLLEIFPGILERDPGALYKKLRRIETALNRAALDYRNTGNVVGWERAERLAAERLENLGISLSDRVRVGLFFNSDAQGYSLKISSEYEYAYIYNAGKRVGRLHIDMAGYGILAPDLTTK
jgi:hypothetical protein